MACKTISNLPTTESCELVFLWEDADGNLVQVSLANLETCLEIAINPWVFENLTVTWNITVWGNVAVTWDITVDDISANDWAFTGILWVAWVATFSGGAQFTSWTVNLSWVTVTGIWGTSPQDAIFDDIVADHIDAATITTSGNVDIGANFNVQWDTDVIDIDVAGALTVTGTSTLNWATTVDDTLTVTGTTSLQDTTICWTLDFCNPTTMDLSNVTVINAGALLDTKYFIDIQSVAVTSASVTVTLTHNFGTVPKLVKLKMRGTQNNLAASNVTLLSGTNIDWATTNAYLPSNFSDWYEIPWGAKECLRFRNDTWSGNPSVQSYLWYLRSLANQTPSTNNRICEVYIQSYSTTQVVILFDWSGWGLHDYLNSNVACLFEIYG